MQARQQKQNDVTLENYLSEHLDDFKDTTITDLMIFARQENNVVSRDQLLLEITPQAGPSIIAKYSHFTNNFLYKKNVTELVCIELNGEGLLRFFVDDIESISYQIVQLGFVDIFSQLFRQER